MSPYRRDGARALAVAAFASGLLVTASAAALTQPDGTVIPQGNALLAFLQANGETIDPLTEAATTPETFTPQCALTFSVLGRGAGQKNSFGWYNVTGQKPAFQDLYEFITCNDGVGTVKTLDIKSDPRYLGGDIAFFEATTEDAFGNCVDWNNPALTLGYVFYSQKGYNDDNTGPSSYIHLLIMDSKVIPNSFWFGWEDLFAGGDNDFEDLLMRVDGIACSGGGDPCDTGFLGNCAFGAMQCVNGVLECVGRQDPKAEECDGEDDDCDGVIDNQAPCPPEHVCYRGKCEPKCGSGEFVCTAGLICNAEGLCVDPDCETVTCPEGQICVDGVCQGPCDGVVCPFGEVCRGGHCADPCDGVTCEAEQVCDDGLCVLKCQCGGCATGEECEGSSGRCVPAGCVDANCPAGQHCVTNVGCVDDCQGAVCPAGEICETGECVPGASDAGTEAGATGGSGPFLDGGLGVGGTAATPGSGGSGGGAATGGNNAGGVDPSRGETAAEPAGCGCRTPGGTRVSALVLLALGALGAAAARRHRR